MSSDDRPTDAGMSIFSTLEAFKDGLTSTLSRAGAADVCRGWAAKIEAADRPDLGGIRDGLVTLARQLDGDTAEGPASAADIGQTMQSLGAHTSEVASTINEEHLVEPLKRLGGYVKGAGIALAGGRRADEIEGIGTLPTGTDGDPMLRSAALAPDVSDDGRDAGRAGAKGLNADVSDDVMATPGDETPGTSLNPN